MLTSLEEFFDDDSEEVEESEASWQRCSSPVMPNFRQEASELHALFSVAGQTAPLRFETRELPQHVLFPVDGDPDLWAVRVKVSFGSSPYIKSDLF